MIYHYDYMAYRDPEITVLVVNTITDRVQPLTHIVEHSPDGFEWGYGGSGPADLALSILTDCNKRLGLGLDIDRPMYQKFKSEIISNQARAGFILGIGAVHFWIKKYLVG